METNEIEKNTETVNNAENAQIKEITQPSAEITEEIIEENVINESDSKSQENADCIDMQKTQRIEILSELLNDTELAQKANIEAKQNGAVREECIEETAEEQSTEKVEQCEENGEQQNQDKKDYKLEKLLLDRINAMQGKIKESLELIKKFERINAKEENLPNIVTTLRDKLTQEVIKQFRTVGIEFNMKSYLVQSIVSDLLNKFEEGITEFKECSENLNFVREVQDDFESRVELAPTSKVKNMFARLRGIFKPERRQEKIFDLERARQEKKLEEANIHLIKYKYKNSELDKYTIRKNIVESLTREMLYGKGTGSSLSISDFIAKKISPQMEKLGLQYLIESLEESLYKEYCSRCEVESKEDFMKISINEAKKSVKMSVYEKVTQITQNAVFAKSEA